MRIGRGGADSGPAPVERVVKILEEYVGGLPAAGLDEPFTFVRTWTLTRTGVGAPLSPTAPADGSLQVGCTVVRHSTAAGGPDEVDDQRTYEQLIGAASALAAHGFGTAEVFEGWRTVAIEVALPSPTRTAEPTEKAEKKRRRGPRRPEPVSVG
ncbi:MULTISPECIES: hypothetical protein [unclassified Frankia]|uniref:hypothetical protein n=1 Tax=unclassified Frankia TaxID=2632575 RepID=UPI001EF53563|nr:MULTISPECIES: hypothetical protein [unclassified Frankia]